LPRLARKRPIVVEYLRFEVGNANIGDVIGWLIEHNVSHIVKGAGIIIRTPGGDMLVEPGHYIIRGTTGEFYPCSPVVFDTVYESVLGR
jgi:hypothetical protein